MTPNFNDDAMEQASFALAATDRTPATSDLLDVIQNLIEYATWINVECAQAENRAEVAEAELTALKRQLEADAETA